MMAVSVLAAVMIGSIVGMALLALTGQIGLSMFWAGITSIMCGIHFAYKDQTRRGWCPPHDWEPTKEGHRCRICKRYL